MSVALQEMVQCFTALQKEYESNEQQIEQLQTRQEEIEGMFRIQNGHVKTARGRPKSKVGRPKSNGEAKVNKTEAIRLYASEHKEARPKDIINALEEKGIQVSSAAVWQAINHPPTGKKRGRPAAKKAAKVKSKKNTGRGRRLAGQTLADAVMKILGRRKNGLTLTEITQRVKSSGYKTSAKDSSVSSAVQGCLTKLRAAEMVAKNDETHRYLVAKTA
jgi:hypothetical protein